MPAKVEGILIFGLGSGPTIEKIVKDETPTTWDLDSLAKARHFFEPTFKKLKPFTVWAYVGKDLEIEQEDFFGEDKSPLTVLHIWVFLGGHMKPESQTEVIGKGIEWWDKFGHKRNQRIDAQAVFVGNYGTLHQAMLNWDVPPEMLAKVVLPSAG